MKTLPTPWKWDSFFRPARPIPDNLTPNGKDDPFRVTYHQLLDEARETVGEYVP